MHEFGPSSLGGLQVAIECQTHVTTYTKQQGYVNLKMEAWKHATEARQTNIMVQAEQSVL